MELALKQVAEIFGVTENRILEWIHRENLPSHLVADKYRFHRTDLLEWAAQQNRRFSPGIYAIAGDELTLAGTHLSDALEFGGVRTDVGGGSLKEVLQNVLADLPLPDSLDHAMLVDLFLSRETMGSTGIGGGVAVPHPRRPVLLNVETSVLRLCYLRQPIDMPVPDGVPVDKLFIMICPTAHEHLQLLARLGALLQVDEVRQALGLKLAGEDLLRVLRAAGQRFHEELSESGVVT